MRRQGWMRLWIVTTFIWLPAFTMYSIAESTDTWARLDKITVEQCVNAEGRPGAKSADACIKDAGVGQTFFQREHITPSSYWLGAFAIALLLDIIATALIVGVFYTGRWVLLGFRAS